MATQEKELLILESIHASSRPIHQRDIAEIVGLSLGMTNAITGCGGPRPVLDMKGTVAVEQG